MQEKPLARASGSYLCNLKTYASDYDSASLNGIAFNGKPKGLTLRLPEMPTPAG
jgi:hypothetical protein